MISQLQALGSPVERLQFSCVLASAVARVALAENADD
jgi:hypothetical protein